MRTRADSDNRCGENIVLQPGNASIERDSFAQAAEEPLRGEAVAPGEAGAFLAVRENGRLETTES
jgi:hypothetical protein